MRFLIPIFALLAALPVTAQEPAVTPTEELRSSVREWVETMRKIQQEENDWSRDQEVLQNYKEGLEKEIADLKQQIADAKTRKAGADQESLDAIRRARPLRGGQGRTLRRSSGGWRRALPPSCPCFPRPCWRSRKSRRASRI